jgi:chorismate synthase
MLRFLTAGESHGPALAVVLEGLPAGLPIDFPALGQELARRQQGYGRGARMQIERDAVEVLGGIRSGRSTGGPISFLIRNKDWENWKDKLSPYPREEGVPLPELVNPRPGHADLAGSLKYGTEDFRDILERSSARETAARVAAGALAKQFLHLLGCQIRSHVVSIGAVALASEEEVPWEAIWALAEDSPLRCVDPEVERRMMEEIDDAGAAGDTVGGAFEVVAHTPPPGLGSFIQWDRRLDGRLAQAICSIPAIKAVGFGAGIEAALRRGSRLHDEIFFSQEQGLYRPTNHAGGLEGGVTNGQELRVKAYMKPLSSLRAPLHSVDIKTKTPVEAARVRSDVSAVPAAGVVAEAMVALTLAAAALEKFGGDSLEETLASYRAHCQRVEQLLKEVKAPTGSL